MHRLLQLQLHGLNRTAPLGTLFRGGYGLGSSVGQVGTAGIKGALSDLQLQATAQGES